MAGHAQHACPFWINGSTECPNLVNPWAFTRIRPSMQAPNPGAHVLITWFQVLLGQDPDLALPKRPKGGNGTECVDASPA